MSFNELVDDVSKKTGLTRAQVRQVLRATTESMLVVLKSGERIVLPGFGTFTHFDVKPALLFGGRVQTRVRRKIRFRQSRRLP